MASMSHYCLGACVSLRKILNNKLSLVQPSNINARHSRNLVVTNSIHSPIPKSTFPQLSSATKRPLIRKVWCSYDALDFSPEFDDISILIRKFFHAINYRDETLLEDVLTHDCIHQDLIFQIPIVRKQNIIQFLCKLKDAMGPDIYVKVHSIHNVQSNDDRSTATAFWHLEWENEEIPFTRGCSVFECTEEVDEKLLIRKITGVTEPGQLGDFILKLLEAAKTIVDKFPDETRKLLSKSNK